MDRNEHEVEEIDRLVSKLTSNPQTPRQPAPPTGQPNPVQPNPGRRWTNVTVRMPSPRRPGLGSRVTDQLEAFGERLELWFQHLRSYVPDVRRLIRMPTAATLVRMWVALAAAYGAAMTFWPYPKTYFWGIVLYQLCLGLSLVASVWGARLSWDARLGAAHTLALGTVLWAATLGTVNTVTVVRGGSWFETPTFAYSTFSPRQLPGTSGNAVSKTNRPTTTPASRETPPQKHGSQSPPGPPRPMSSTVL